MTAACVHGHRSRCPFPGCRAGPEGDLVIADRSEVIHFVRAFVVVNGRAQLGWMESKRVPARRAEEVACPA